MIKKLNWKTTVIAVMIVLIEFPFVIILMQTGVSADPPRIFGFISALAFSIFIFGVNHKPGKPAKWVVFLWVLCGTVVLLAMATGFVHLDESSLRTLERVGNWWATSISVLFLVLYFKKLLRVPPEANHD